MFWLWGNIGNYVISYFHFLGDKRATHRMGVAVIPVYMSFCDFTAPSSAFLMKRIHVKLIIALGAAFLLGGILLASYMTTWWSFFVSYSVLTPLGIGIFYWVPIFCAWEWFPERKGLISGLIVGSIGMGNFAFNMISTTLINPDNVLPGTIEGTTDILFPKEIAERFPKMIRQCMVPWTILCVIAICLITRHPKYDIRNKQSRQSETKSSEVENTDKANDE